MVNIVNPRPPVSVKKIPGANKLVMSAVWAGENGLWVRANLDSLSTPAGYRYGYGFLTIEICDPRKKIIVKSITRVMVSGLNIGVKLKIPKAPKKKPRHVNFSDSVWNLWFTKEIWDLDITQIKFKKVSLWTAFDGTSPLRTFYLEVSDNKKMKYIYEVSNHQMTLGRNLNVAFTKARIWGHRFSTVKKRSGNCLKNRRYFPHMPFMN